MELHLLAVGRGCWKAFGLDEQRQHFSFTFFTSEDPRGKTKAEIEKRYLILFRDLKNMRQALRLMGQLTIPKTKRGCKKLLKELFQEG